MNIWLTELTAAAHVDDLLRDAGQPARQATSRTFIHPEDLPDRTRASRIRPRVGGLLIKAGTRLSGPARAA